MNTQTQEALKMAKQHIIERKGRRGGAVCYVKSDEEVIKAIDEALAQPAREPVACPYPCGWDNLYKSIIEQGAYLARKRHENNENDEVFDEFLCSMNNIAKYLCEWGKSLTHPATWQSLNDDEIENILDNSVYCEVDAKPFARAIEQALKEKNHEQTD